MQFSSTLSPIRNERRHAHTLLPFTSRPSTRHYKASIYLVTFYLASVNAPLRMHTHMKHQEFDVTGNNNITLSLR